jgi:hypothetical protein
LAKAFAEQYENQLAEQHITQNEEDTQVAT